MNSTHGAEVDEPISYYAKNEFVAKPMPHKHRTSRARARVVSPISRYQGNENMVS